MDLKSGFPFSLIRFGLPFNYPRLTRSVTTDVVIIGGGISGALMAFHLVREGVSCMLVDGRTIGLGSTCASTSLLQYEIDVSLTDLMEKIGKQKAVRAYEQCLGAIHKLGEIAAQVRLDEFKYNKSLYFAAEKKHLAFLQKEFKARKNHGFNVAYLGEQEVFSNFGFRSPAAILSEDGAYADAYLFTHHLLQHCIKKEMQVFDRTYIKKITEHKNGIVLTTADDHTIKAGTVIYATGYEVTEMLRKKIVNLKSTYVTISEQRPASANSEKDVMLWNTGDPYLYLRSTSDGRTLVGGRDEEFFNPAKRDKLIGKKSKQLVNDYRKLFPDQTFNPEFSWAGTFGSTQDGLPFIGRYSKYPRSYFALGFGGNGITFSLIAAEIITGLIKGKKSKDASIFAFERV